MAKPKGYKAQMQIEREQREEKKRSRKAIKEMLADAKPGKPIALDVGSQAETVFECDCGEKSKWGFELESGTVYKLKCPACGAHKFAKKSKAWEMLADNYPGPFVEACGAWDDTLHLSKWWSAMPGSEHQSLAVKAIKAIQTRDAWLLANKVKPKDDSEYERLKGELGRAHEQIFVGYDTIEPTTTEKIRAAHVRLRQRVELLIEKGITPKGDQELADEHKTIVEGENVLYQIWNESGQSVAFKNPRIRERVRDEKRKQIAQAKLKQDEIFDKADKDWTHHRLEQRAEIIARADKRGHTAPLVAHAKELVHSVRRFVEPGQLPKGSLVYDFARFIRWDDYRTWPTMHEFVMAFAESDEVIRPIISAMKRTRRRHMIQTRPVRYSPAVIHHLIHWWLTGPGKTADKFRRDGFEHVEKVLVL
ncbi:MAG: hypothetical protein WCN98_06445 [Verrucomicrobiaceae bacterium]